MNISFATESQILDWNNLILKNPDGGDLFQIREFAEVKQRYNWTPKYIVMNNIFMLALERKIPILGKFWYIPKGPGINSIDNLKKALPQLKKFAKQNNVFCIRIEPELIASENNINELNKLGLYKARPIQAANTIIVDISKSIDEIMAGFSSKIRGNIRAAQKANVITEVVPISDQNCKIFYDLMTQTINGRSHLRDFNYFKTFWKTHYNGKTGMFIFAKADDVILSMDFIILNGKKAARKDAASIRDHSVRGASALLELEVIKYLKNIGVTAYDLYGSPPSDQIKNPQHPYYGFGTFKAGFNSKVTDFIGCYDAAVKPAYYSFWAKFGERIARKIYYYKHHDLYF